MSVDPGSAAGVGCCSRFWTAALEYLQQCGGDSNTTVTCRCSDLFNRIVCCGTCNCLGGNTQIQGIQGSVTHNVQGSSFTDQQPVTPSSISSGSSASGRSNSSDSVGSSRVGVVAGHVLGQQPAPAGVNNHPLPREVDF